MSNNKKLGKFQPVDLREAWGHEAEDFTPWLALRENLEELAKALNFDELEPLETEHFVGDFKLDILCANGTERVVIENQLDVTDHKHLGQLLAYAAGTNAKKVVWVAKDFRKEHIAALHFLNANTSKDLNFFAVRIELWRIDDSRMAPKFEVVVRPDGWTKEHVEQARVAEANSPLHQLRERFWTAFSDQMEQREPQLRLHSPGPWMWLGHAIGKRGYGLNAVVNVRDARLSVEIFINRSDAKQQFALLQERKPEIESALGFALDWQALPDGKASRIVISLEDASIAEEGRWSEYFDWLVPRFAAMERVFRPIIKNLP